MGWRQDALALIILWHRKREEKKKTTTVMFYVNDVKILHELTEDSNRNVGGESEILKIDLMVGEVNLHLSFLSKT